MTPQAIETTILWHSNANSHHNIRPQLGPWRVNDRTQSILALAVESRPITIWHTIIAYQRIGQDEENLFELFVRDEDNEDNEEEEEEEEGEEEDDSPRSC